MDTGIRGGKQVSTTTSPARGAIKLRERLQSWLAVGGLSLMAVSISQAIWGFKATTDGPTIHGTAGARQEYSYNKNHKTTIDDVKRVREYKLQPERARTCTRLLSAPHFSGQRLVSITALDCIMCGGT